MRRPDKTLLSPEIVNGLKGKSPQLELIPATLQSSLDRVRSAAVSSLQDLRRHILRASESLERVLASASFINALEAALNVTSEVLTIELERYFEFVLIYHTGVFARHAKDAISRAGLGRRLDNLEHEMSVEQRQVLKTASCRRLLGPIDESVAQYKISAPIIAAEVGVLSERLAGFRMEATGVDQADEEIWGDLFEDEHEKLMRDVSEKLGSHLEVFVGEAGALVGRARIDAAQRFNNEERDLRVERRRRIRNISLSVGTIGLVVVLVYVFLKTPVENTVRTAVLLGIVASVLGNGLGYFLARLTDKFPESLTKLAMTHSDNLRLHCHEDLKALKKTTKTPTLNEQEIVARLVNVAAAILDRALAADEEKFTSEALQALRSMRDEQERLRTKCNEVLEAAILAASEALGRHDITAAHLEEIGTKIRNQEISPSFDLLDETERRYRSVQEKLSRITFA